MIILMSKRSLVLILTGILILSCAGAAFAHISQTRGRSDFEDIVWAVETPEKVIALTFDDGPDPVYTPQILDILHRNGVRGTFFVVGRQVERFPKISRRIVEDGHEIANHTYSHPLLNKIKMDRLKEELDMAYQTICRITHLEPALFRPPGGFYNEKIVELATGKGYKVVLWSWTQDTRDWANPGTDLIIRQVLKNAANGDIVILHDRGGDRSQTVNALQPIIEGLQDRGFALITVSELLKKGEQSKMVTGKEFYE